MLRDHKAIYEMFDSYIAKLKKSGEVLGLLLFHQKLIKTSEGFSLFVGDYIEMMIFKDISKAVIGFFELVNLLRLFVFAFKAARTLRLAAGVGADIVFVFVGHAQSHYLVLCIPATAKILKILQPLGILV